MEFLFVLVILPLAVLAASIIGLFFVQRWHLISIDVFVVFTGFSAIVIFVMRLIRKGKGNQGSVV